MRNPITRDILLDAYENVMDGCWNKEMEPDGLIESIITECLDGSDGVNEADDVVRRLRKLRDDVDQMADQIENDNSEDIEDGLNCCNSDQGVHLPSCENREVPA